MTKISLGRVFGLGGISWSFEEIAMEAEFDDFAFEIFEHYENRLPLAKIDPDEVVREVMEEIEIPAEFDPREVRAHVLKRVRMWCNLPEPTRLQS